MNTFTRSTCPYCGVGCGVIIESIKVQGGAESIIGVSGDPLHPANFGKLCSKGANLALTAAPLIQQQARQATPQIRASRELPLCDASWDDALNLAATKFDEIINAHGPDAVAFYVSGQLLTEDYYVFNKLAKGLIGTNNIDTNSRLCMSSAVAGYKASLGADAPPCSYDDIDHTGVLFISGSNTAYAHPVLYRRIEDARKNNPSLKTIVVDPRLTDTAREADLFLPILPGTDVALYNAMLHQMLWEGWIDRPYIAAHTEGFEALRSAVREYTPAHASRLCGVPEADIVLAAKWFFEGPTLSLYCQGLNQSIQGTDKNTALINLHLVTAQIGKPGAGPFSLTGQPNAMGGREVGGLANLLSAHRDMANELHRAEVAKLWNVNDVPDKPGKTAVELFQALEKGTIKAVWIACTNPANSMPDLDQIGNALRRAQFVVVQEAYANTATTAFADLVLPATTWGEKDGTVTNSERRISRVCPAIAPFAQARHDWQIARDFALRLLQISEATERAKPAISFDYPSAESVWNEHRESTRGRDLDITGLSYAILESDGPQQWPMLSGQIKGTTRLYSDGQFATANGKAKLLFSAYQPIADKVSARFPLVLNTGRLRDQWHTMTRTGLTSQMFSHEAEPWLDMNTLDMSRRGIHEGDFVIVTSPRASQVFRARQSNAQRSGQCFLPMHWGPEYLLRGGVNRLTQPAFDPRSKQPELKAAAIRVERINLAHRLTAFGIVSNDKAIAIRHAVKQQLAQHDAEFISIIPLSTHSAEQEQALLVRIASARPLGQLREQSVSALIESLFEVNRPRLMRYADTRVGHQRAVLIDNDQLKFAILAGDMRSEQWLMHMLQVGQAVGALSRQMLLAQETPPPGVAARSKTVCTCVGVNESEINSAIDQFNTRQIQGVLDTMQNSSQACFAWVQNQTQCSTQCGSCKPEVNGLIQQKIAIKELSHAS